MDNGAGPSALDALMVTCTKKVTRIEDNASQVVIPG